MTTSTSTALPLTLAAPGETAEVLEIRLHGDEKQRLQELGMTLGSLIRVVKSDAANGVIIAVRHDGRLALNRSTAHKIVVRLQR